VNIAVRLLLLVTVVALVTAALTPPYHDVDESGVVAIGNRVAMIACAAILVGWFL
jgi:hypothetical protein